MFRKDLHHTASQATVGPAMLLAMLLAVALAGGMASAQDILASPLGLLGGTWKIASSEPTPWPHESSWEVPAQIKQLVGATVVLRADRIDGPRQLACSGPHYKIEQYSVGMLFQGTLAEKGDPKTTPDQAATALGLTQRPIPSLTTGCASEIEFHIIDGDHMLFGLDNRVYRMVRVIAAARTVAPVKAKP